MSRLIFFAFALFYCIAISYLFLGLVQIGFPLIDKGEIIRGVFSFITTSASLLVAYFAYKAANKSAIATEKAAKASEIAAFSAEQSLFNATFETRLMIYKTMWELNSILEEVDRYVGVSKNNPEKNFVSKELVERLNGFHEVLIYKSKVLPEMIQKKISKFYIDVRHEITCQVQPSDLPDQLEQEFDKELIAEIDGWKVKNHKRNIEFKDILNELSPYIKAP